MENTRHSRAIGLLLGGIGAILFSLKGIVMKLAFAEGGSVEQMMALRMGIALPFFLAIGFWSQAKSQRQMPRRTIVFAALLGALSYYVCTWLDFTGLQYISVQLERLILFLYPTFTALFAWLFLSDRMSWGHAGALLLSYLGVGVLALQELGYPGSNVALGAGLVFLSAILFAGYVTAAKPVISQLGSLVFTSIAMSAAAICIIAHFAIGAASTGPPLMTPALWYLGAMLAIPCTVIPSFMVSEAIGRVGPGLTSAIGGIAPLATALFAVIVLSEPFGWPHAVALALTTIGVLLLSRSRDVARK